MKFKHGDLVKASESYRSNFKDFDDSKYGIMEIQINTKWMPYIFPYLTISADGKEALWKESELDFA